MKKYLFIILAFFVAASTQTVSAQTASASTASTQTASTQTASAPTTSELTASVSTGGAAQASAPEQDVVSNSNAPASAPEKEDMPDDSFSKEDYQKLLALQFDDYRHMKISEFQNKVWEMTDTPEYTELLERFFKSETLYQMKDSDETAAFLFYVLGPLTAEKWPTYTYSGAVTSDFPDCEDNARLEYTYTLTILAADKIMVKDYCDVRVNVRDAMNSMMLGRAKEELQSEEFMQAELKTFVEGILPGLQAPELAVAIEYAYFPLSAGPEDGQGTGPDNDLDQEQRTYANGTKSDYRSLLALKTSDYQDTSLADFNAALMAWADEDYERMERIDEDDRFDDFKVPLSEDERSFVELTVFLSGREIAKYVQSVYCETPEGDPWHDQYLPVRFGASGGVAGYCSLYYQFSWHISDKEAVTVGERDGQISDMMKAVRNFWDKSETGELLKMSQSDIVQELKKIAAEYSTSNVIITIDNRQVHFEHI